MDLRDYRRLGRLKMGLADFGAALDSVSNLYQGKRRLSGRTVIQHLIETAEVTSWYTSELVYLMTAILHDCREDLNLSFEDVRQISGTNGVRVAEMVTALSKRSDLTNWKERNEEYMDRLAKAIEKNHWLGIIKVADRVSNLTDIQALPQERRETIAMQTLDFYVPIALGLGTPGIAIVLKELSLPHIGDDLRR
jgi:(p)ppGpp synthase/HD superfamily hydrolase